MLYLSFASVQVNIRSAGPRRSMWMFACKAVFPSFPVEDTLLIANRESTSLCCVGSTKRKYFIWISSVSATVINGNVSDKVKVHRPSVQQTTIKKKKKRLEWANWLFVSGDSRRQSMSLCWGKKKNISLEAVLRNHWIVCRWLWEGTFC